MTGGMYRPDFRVVARILEALGRSGRPMRPTQLQQASGTNYTQFRRYLDLLRERGMVTVDEGTGPDSGTIRLTSKGEEAHRFLIQMISELLPPVPDRRR
jgi:predicted transcriptional regulator